MSWFNKYILLVMLVKFTFVVFSISHLIMKAKGKEDSELDTKFVFWKKRIEFVFIILMSLLLIYLFNPRQNNSNNLNFETKLLLYVFGFIMIITAKWSTFIHENPLFKKFQGVV